jgi:hypothetical protein
MIGRWGMVLAGIWLVIAPWVLGITEATARTNDFWIGLAVIVVALVSGRVPGFRFVNSGLGGWLIAAPFLLSYMTMKPLKNDVILGMIVLALSLIPSIRWSDIRRREEYTAPS